MRRRRDDRAANGTAAALASIALHGVHPIANRALQAFRKNPVVRERLKALLSHDGADAGLAPPDATPSS